MAAVSMTAETVFEPDRIVRALNYSGVEYVIVGGLAVAAHGVVRATRDLDLVPAGSEANMDRLARCFVALGAERPVEEQLTGATLGRPVSFTVTTRHGEVQLLNRMHGVPPFEQLERDQVTVEIAPDVLAPVCSLPHMREMKRAADRPRDRVDLAELDELHGTG
jgi:hypothetical protein